MRCSNKVQGGGNVGNALTCASRLGLNARLISKVANDNQGRGFLEEIQADGVDVSFFVVSSEGNSSFSYIIVDNQTKTRTCIHTPGSHPVVLDDLKTLNLPSALTGVKLAYFDARLPEIGLVIAHQANQRGIPILIDVEKPRKGLDKYLDLSDYVVCPANLPQAWTKAPTVSSALISMVSRLPKLKFLIVTLGSDGCIMLERSMTDGSDAKTEEMDVDNLLELLKQKIDCSTTTPTCISSANQRGIPILIDVEKPRKGLDKYLDLSDYVVCPANLPQAWTKSPTVSGALISMVSRLPKLKFLIVTLGSDGCIMLERRVTDDAKTEEMDVDNLLELLKQKIDCSTTTPTCISSGIARLQAKGVGSVYGRLHLGTAEKIPESELIDTTGAGDAFVGAILYAICTKMPPEQMLPFAAQVAAISCRALGARTSLPRLSDSRLKPFLG